MPPHAAPLVLLADVAATLYMTGLVWFVQVVHYPLFAGVGTDRWPAYAESHQRLTTWVVGPPMLVELATAVLLAWRPPDGATRVLPLAALALLGVVWLSTALLQVPAHGRLTSGFDAGVARGLVRWNWLRTIAWTARAVVVLALVGRQLR